MSEYSNFWENEEDPVNLFPVQNGIPFYIQPDTLQEGGTYALPLMLGNEEIPAEEVYGVAFSILYDPDIIKPGARFRLSDSWFGQTNDLIVMQKEYHDIGRLEVGITRLDGMNSSGWGDIGDFIISIEDSNFFIIIGRKSFLILELLKIFMPMMVCVFKAVAGGAAGTVMAAPLFRLIAVPLLKSIKL